MRPLDTIFLLGNNPALAAAELAAVMPQQDFFPLAPQVLRCRSAVADAPAILSRLGGTVKIGEVVALKFTPAAVADDIVRRHSGGKALFAVSWISGGKRATHLAAGLEVKAILKQRGMAARLVTSRAMQLPAAAINRHGAIEYVVLPDGSVARVVAAQDVDDFSRRDVGRPHRDLESGTMPPKLARMMVNLARVPPGGTLLDPFCGSGTILTEALLAGMTSVIGTDVSAKAVTESQANLRWLRQHYPQTKSAQWSVKPGDVRQLRRALGGQMVAAIVTEPYLGPPLHGRETRAQLQAVMSQLAALYTEAFRQFAAVLKPSSRAVVAFPEFVVGRETMAPAISREITSVGFRLDEGPYAYSRPDQHVRRHISVWVRVA